VSTTVLSEEYQKELKVATVKLLLQYCSSMYKLQEIKEKLIKYAIPIFSHESSSTNISCQILNIFKEHSLGSCTKKLLKKCHELQEANVYCLEFSVRSVV
jgi:predicted transcriptional regulator